MDAGVNVESGGFGPAVPFDDVALEIADEQARRGDLAEGAAVGIDEEEVVAARHEGREMIADALGEAESRRHAKTGGKVDAGPAESLGVDHTRNGRTLFERSDLTRHAPLQAHPDPESR